MPQRSPPSPRSTCSRHRFTTPYVAVGRDYSGSSIESLAEFSAFEAQLNEHYAERFAEPLCSVDSSGNGGLTGTLCECVKFALDESAHELTEPLATAAGLWTAVEVAIVGVSPALIA